VELRRARECTTGTRTHSYNAAVMWPSKWLGNSAIGRVFRQRLDWTKYIQPVAATLTKKIFLWLATFGPKIEMDFVA